MTQSRTLPSGHVFRARLILLLALWAHVPDDPGATRYDRPHHFHRLMEHPNVKRPLHSYVLSWLNQA